MTKYGGGGVGWNWIRYLLVSDCGDGYTFNFHFYFSIWPSSQKNKFPFPQLIGNVQKICRVLLTFHFSLLFTCTLELLTILHLCISGAQSTYPVQKIHGIYYDTLCCKHWCTLPGTFSNTSAIFDYVLAPTLLMQQERSHQNTGALMHRCTNMLVVELCRLLRFCAIFFTFAAYPWTTNREPGLYIETAWNPGLELLTVYIFIDFKKYLQYYH